MSEEVLKLFNRLMDRLDQIESKVDGIDDKVDKLETKVDDLEEKMAQGFAEVNRRLDNLEHALDHILRDRKRRS
jgi:tetrahydromethanopterin S-methyltransferase subunit G